MPPAQGAQRDEVDVLYYELMHNLVLELTRIGIETEEPQDAAGVAVQPDRLRRAARTGARRRRPVPAGTVPPRASHSRRDHAGRATSTAAASRIV